jgi:1,4-alpha-glucan branching enzyme
VPEPSRYIEILSSDAADYAGSGLRNSGRDLITEELPWMSRPHSLVLTLPPLAGVVLKLAPVQSTPPETEAEDEVMHG